MSQIHVESDLTRYEMIDYLLGMEEYHNNSERDIEDTVGWIWLDCPLLVVFTDPLDRSRLWLNPDKC